MREECQGGRRRRRRGSRVLLVLVVLLALGGGAAAYLREDAPPPRPQETAQAPQGPLEDSGTAPLAGGGTAPSPLSVRLDLPTDNIDIKFKKPPRSALVFDLDTGRVLYRREPTKVLPIASLTKMMTALVVADRVPPGSKVRVTKEALRYQGSGVGLLPRGKWIGINTMLYGLMLPSGNDAAIALAQRAAKGSVRRFVRYMNEKAEEMGLLCTRFSTPSGFEDKGNHSCAADQAAIARAVLREPRLARIVRKREAIVPFPIKGGQALPLQPQPAAAPGLPRDDRPQDRLHGRRRALSGRHGAPRRRQAGRRPA